MRNDSTRCNITSGVLERHLTDGEQPDLRITHGYKRKAMIGSKTVRRNAASRLSSVHRHRLPRTFVSVLLGLTFATVATPVSNASDLIHNAGVTGPKSTIHSASHDKITEHNSSNFKLAAGDKLRINVYERPDLSGVFGVRANGTISLPLLGSFEAGEKTPGDLETEIANALTGLIPRQLNLTISVESWRPIYAVGDVDDPGVYAFTPGMTALHALAAAGGFYRPPLSADVTLTVNRELTDASAELRRTIEKLKRALALKARLVAERDGKKKVTTPQELLELAGEAEADRLIAAENRMLLRRARAHQPKLEARQKEIGLIKIETAAYNQQQKKIDRSISLTSGQLKRFDNLQKKGLALSSRMLDLRREIATLEAQSGVVVASIARAEQTLARVTREKKTLTVDRELQIERDLKLAEEEISELVVSLQFSKNTIRQISAYQVKALSKPIQRPAAYQIMRAVGNKQTLLAVEETTQLQPGDVLRVTRPITSGPNATH